MEFKELTNKIEAFTPLTEKIPPKIVDLLYLVTGATGELGELANLVKKLARGDPIKKIATKIMNARDDHTLLFELPPLERWETIINKELEEEIAGTFIYLELMCRVLEVDLGELVAKEVDKIHKKRSEPISKGWEDYRSRKNLEGE